MASIERFSACQTPPRFIQPAVAHKDAGRLLESRLKTPHEMTRGEAGSLGQRRDREIALQVGRDPAGQFRQSIRRHRLKAQRFRILILAARPFQKDDQIARHPQRRLAPQVFLDQSQREIDPGRHAGRGVEMAVLNKECVRLHPQIGKTPGHIGRRTANESSRAGHRADRWPPGRRCQCRSRRRGGSSPPRSSIQRATARLVSARRSPAPPGMMIVSSLGAARSVVRGWSTIPDSATKRAFVSPRITTS